MTSLQQGIQDVCPQNNLAQVPTFLFLTLVNSLFKSKCNLGSKEHYPKDYGPNLLDQDVFDFIIVGSGSAGSVLANKLSENSKYRVLVLEAGGYPSAESDIPSLLFSLMKTEDDWEYKTSKNDKHCAGLDDAACLWPRGKCLGGCSSTNAMLYVRGNHRDYDKWAEEGNIGWDWESVLKIYKSIESIKDPHIKSLGSYGTDGLLPLTKYEFDENVRTSLFDAFEELGVPKIPQENPYEPIGIFDTVQNLENGERANTAKVFLGSAKDRKNLFLAINAHVTKVLIDRNTKTTSGVEVVMNHKKIKVFASKEVILSGGTINTPQILMLSGIGPKDHLQLFDIDAIQDLPVGKNLQDHVISPVYCKLDETAVRPKPPTYAIDEFYKYLIHREGEFSKIRLTNVIGFVNTKNDSKYPNLQMHFIVTNANDDYLLPVVVKSQGHSLETIEKELEDNKDSAILLLWPTLLNPKSRGRVMLKSDNPFEKPLINAGYLTDKDEEDLSVLLDGIRFVQKLLKTSSFKKHNPILGKYVLKNCEKLEYDSDDFWKCVVKNLGTTLYHPTSTARMGVDPKISVVDSKLRVHGVKKLRIADASIMPHVTSGNTNAPCMMIGYKAGEIILEDWREENNKKRTEL